MPAPTLPPIYGPGYDPNKKAGQYREGRGPGTIDNMSRSEVAERMQDPPDAARKKDLDRLARKAMAGDPAALLKLRRQAALPGYGRNVGGDQPTGYGLATRDARNYARRLIQDVTGEDIDYVKPGDAYVGDTLGKIAKFAAPLAGMLIPGVGLLGAAAIGAAGNAGGQYLERGKINPLQVGLAGAAGAAGNALLGNGLGAGGTGMLGGSAPGGIGAAGGAAGAVNPITGYATTPVVEGAAGAGAAGAVGAAGSGGKLLGLGTPSWSDVGQIGLGAYGTYENARRQAEADRLRGKALDLTMDDWKTRDPVRQAALQKIMAPMSARPDLSAIYASPNPYARPAPRG